MCVGDEMIEKIGDECQNQAGNRTGYCCCSCPYHYQLCHRGAKICFYLLATSVKHWWLILFAWHHFDRTLVSKMINDVFLNIIQEFCIELLLLKKSYFSSVKKSRCRAFISNLTKWGKSINSGRCLPRSRIPSALSSML